jgi:hypothetical protein
MTPFEVLRHEASQNRNPQTRRPRQTSAAARTASGGNHQPHGEPFSSPRATLRFSAIRDLIVLYEGSSRPINLRTPDISTRGMFINTGEQFPQGAVLRLSFRLPHSQRLIETRCEVRYCLPGVGIGVEYVDLADSSRLAIEDELRHI